MNGLLAQLGQLGQPAHTDDAGKHERSAEATDFGDRLKAALADDRVATAGKKDVSTKAARTPVSQDEDDRATAKRKEPVLPSPEMLAAFGAPSFGAPVPPPTTTPTASEPISFASRNSAPTTGSSLAVGEGAAAGPAGPELFAPPNAPLVGSAGIKGAAAESHMAGPDGAVSRDNAGSLGGASANAEARSARTVDDGANAGSNTAGPSGEAFGAGANAAEASGDADAGSRAFGDANPWAGDEFSGAKAGSRAAGAGADAFGGAKAGSASTPARGAFGGAKAGSHGAEADAFGGAKAGSRAAGTHREAFGGANVGDSPSAPSAGPANADEASSSEANVAGPVSVEAFGGAKNESPGIALDLGTTLGDPGFGPAAAIMSAALGDPGVGPPDAVLNAGLGRPNEALDRGLGGRALGSAAATAFGPTTTLAKVSHGHTVVGKAGKPVETRESTGSTHAKPGRTDIDPKSAQIVETLKPGKWANADDGPSSPAATIDVAPLKSAAELPSTIMTATPNVASHGNVKNVTSTATAPTAVSGGVEKAEQAVKAAEMSGHRRTLASAEAHGHIVVPELGRVEVRAQTDASANVAVHVHVDDAHGRAVVAAHAPELRAHVRADVPNAHVHLDRGNSGNSERRQTPSNDRERSDASEQSDEAGEPTPKRYVRGRARFVL
jgi:hypothetical protein